VQDFPPCVVSQVRDDTAFIRIEIYEEPAFFLVGLILILGEGPAPSGQVALGQFDLDYFGTEISEKLRRKRPHHTREP
jgi:hypothetical protein